MQTDTATAPDHDERHFAIDLLGLIARVVATAVAINIVFAAIVLLLATPAQAAPMPGGVRNPPEFSATPIRACAAEPVALSHENKLALIHRLGHSSPNGLIREH